MDCIDLSRHCNERVSRSWDDRASWAGLSAGRAFAHGVPYVIVEPDANAGKMAVCKKSFPLWRRAAGVFLVSSRLRTNELAVALTTGAYHRVDPGKGLPVRTGRPLRDWELWLYPLSLPKDAEIEEIWVLGQAHLFAVTIDRRSQDAAERIRQVVAEADERESQRRLAQGLRDEMVFGCSERVGTELARKQIRAAFLPPHGPPARRIRDALEELGIPSVALRPAEAVDPAVLKPTEYPMLVYTSAEHYLRSVNVPGDGERALLRYLKQGGTLVVMGACRPFTYADDLVPSSPGAHGDEWALFGRQFGLDLLGPDERRDNAIGFEQVPEGELVFRLERGQDVLSGIPDAITFPTAGDRRFRPAAGEKLPPDDEFIPVLSLYDEAGTRYGPAMALIKRHSPGFTDANILWVWGTLIGDDFAHADAVLYESLAKAAEICAPGSARPVLAPPQSKTHANVVGVLPLTDPGRAELVESICAEMDAGCERIAPDLLVDPIGFTPSRFPIAVHAPREETFVNTWRLPQDGADAYVRYVDEGGFLIASGNATQFWYPLDFEAGEWQTRQQTMPTMARALRLPIEYGFERPQDEMILEPAANAEAAAFLPRAADVTAISDQRWRALARVRGADTEFIPLAYLTDGDGRRYNGYAAALIRRKTRAVGAGSLLYVWGNLIEGTLGEQIMRSSLQLALQEVQELPAG